MLFSPHPEMGDLVRKYMALDGYVRHYLPIRGFGTMRDTLRHYRISDSPSFRLVQNAIDELMTTARARAGTRCRADGNAAADGDIVALCRREADALPDFGAGEEGDLLRDVAARVCARIDPAGTRAAAAVDAGRKTRRDCAPSWRHLAATMTEHFGAAPVRTPAQQLMELELSVALVENWTRAAELDLAMAGHGMSEADVRLDKVRKSFGAVVAVNDVTLDIERGTIFSLLGPSGCGKTTTLRLIAGFEQPSAGEVYIRGQRVTAIAPYRRDFSMVFQSYALFPHLNVAENVAFGLRMRRVPRGERGAAVKEALELVKLGALADRYPRQLSGGQQQRVALARAIVVKPAVLLLDEPLGALDKMLREEMQVELRDLQQRLGITAVFVTHDQEEALTLSDRVAVMRGGVIEQIGAPREIYDRP